MPRAGSPYSWTITQGTLPNGLTLNATSGIVSGTPTDIGKSSFTVQVSDHETSVATAVASLSIAINPPPPRNAALYLSDQTGLQIQSDGSLTLLPSSPESASTGYMFGSSSKLPLLFLLGNPPTNLLESLLINQDYSLTLYSSAPLHASSFDYVPPAIEPTGSNLYLPGPIDSNLTPGVTIYPGNGSLQSVGSIAIPNVSAHSRLVFTPDGTLAFISTCVPSHVGSILSYSRSSDGMLTPATVYVIPGNFCAESGLATSPDGKYLATGEVTGEVQVYRVASDGSLTPVLLQSFTVTLDPQGDFVSLHDMTWDQSSSFLLAATGLTDNFQGGVAALSFSGRALTETVYPTGPAQGSIRRTGSFVYSTPLFPHVFSGPAGIFGFNFQNGQLIALPGSPYPYGKPFSDVVVYLTARELRLDFRGAWQPRTRSVLVDPLLQSGRRTVQSASRREHLGCCVATGGRCGWNWSPICVCTWPKRFPTVPRGGASMI